MNDKVRAAAGAVEGLACHQGIIATGDQFVGSKDKLNRLMEEFGAVACEMEGGSIGQVCALNKIPFAVIRAISDHGERAACKVTVTRKNEEAARKKPTLDTTSLSLVLQYNDLHPTHQLQLTNSDHSFLYVYQWMSSNPEVATVSDKGLVTAQAAGTTTITAMVSNGQALRCSVTVTSDIGKVTLNKSDLLLRTVGTQERLTATVAVEGGGSVPITWVSSNPGVVTVDADGVVTAIADGEAKVTALSPAGRFDVCSVVVGMAAEKYESEATLPTSSSSLTPTLPYG